MTRIYNSCGSLCKFPFASAQRNTLKIAVEIKTVKFQGFQHPGSPSVPGGLRGLLSGNLVYRLAARKPLRTHNERWLSIAILDNNGIHQQDVVCVITITVVLYDSRLDGRYHLFYMLHLLYTRPEERILSGWMAYEALHVKHDNIAKQTW